MADSPDSAGNNPQAIKLTPSQKIRVLWEKIRGRPAKCQAFWHKVRAVFSRQSDGEPEPFVADNDLGYVHRLFEEFRALKNKPSLEPLILEGELTEGLLGLNPRLQAALATLTGYTPSKWLLEKELANRFRNKKNADGAGSFARTRRRLDLITALTESRDELVRKLTVLQNSPDTKPIGPEGNLSPSDFVNARKAENERIQKDIFSLETEIDKLRLKVDATLKRYVERRAAESKPAWPDALRPDVYDVAAEQRLTGIAFSGGGIRSATFCLGVLQSLAAAKLLPAFDYLSTVSGGGYIHQWFASWVAADPNGLDGVAEKLIPLPEPGCLARTPKQISWLRQYASYLTPQRGIFSADSWTLVCTWLRNTFLNQIVLFAFLGCCLLVARSATWLFVKDPNNLLFHWGKPESATFIGWLLVLGTVLSCFRLVAALNSVTSSTSSLRALQLWFERLFGGLGELGVVLWFVLPAFAASLLLALQAEGGLFSRSISVFGLKTSVLLIWCFHMLCVLLTITFGGRAPRDVYDLTRSQLIQIAASQGFALSAFLLTVLSFYATSYLVTPSAGSKQSPLEMSAQQIVTFGNEVFHHPPTQWVSHSESADGGRKQTLDVRVVRSSDEKPAHPFATADILASFSPVLFSFLFCVAIRIQIGVLGRYYAESRREWLARFGAWHGILGTVWVLLCVLSRLGPVIFYWFFSSGNPKRIAGVVGAVLIHFVTLSAGSSEKTDGRPKSGTVFGYSALDLVGIIGAPICLLILLIIVSGVVDVIILNSSHWASLLFHVGQNYCHYLPIELTRRSFAPVLFFAVLVILLLFFGWRVDVNEFSLHGFYRNRLARCYLGATNDCRTPDPFTGFDDHDETSISNAGKRVSQLLPKKFWAGKQPSTEDRGDTPYDGPYPIFCSTINLTFGEDLGWQERKAASFAFAPLYSGYHIGQTSEGNMGVLKRNVALPSTLFNGYVPTASYAYRQGGVSLSTAAAISGAALSPNQGYSTQPTLAFLMTLFNVRLGWWIVNPRQRGLRLAQSGQPTPTFGLKYLLSELFGLANDERKYVYLSDGGQFENMGLYELVRRRCRFIVVCDAEMDTGTCFEGIGRAIAKCRTDFGAEIDLDLKPLMPNKDTGLAAQHFVTGTIDYPPAIAGNDVSKYRGHIVYLKTSITGDEPGDILNYRRTHPNFPQDSTLNQWFTESKFESYRRLGQLIGKQASSQVKRCLVDLP